MKGHETYKIRIKDGTDEYQVYQRGDITHVQWRNELGKPFMLAYLTKEVIHRLKEGVWVRVNKNNKSEVLKSSNLFNLDDL